MESIMVQNPLTPQSDLRQYAYYSTMESCLSKVCLEQIGIRMIFRVNVQHMLA